MNHYIVFKSKVDLVKAISYLSDKLYYKANYADFYTDCLHINISGRYFKYSYVSSAFLDHINQGVNIATQVTFEEFIKIIQ